VRVCRVGERSGGKFVVTSHQPGRGHPTKPRGAHEGRVVLETGSNVAVPKFFDVPSRGSLADLLTSPCACSRFLSNTKLDEIH